MLEPTSNTEGNPSIPSVPTAQVIEGATLEGLPVAQPVEQASSSLAEPEEREIASIPDPFPQHIVSLSADTDGPKIRLQRSNRYRQMRIVTDEKPDPKYLQMFRDAGMKWRAQDKAWTIQLEKDAAWRTALDIEKLFVEVANGIRTDRGLPEITPLGR